MNSAAWFNTYYHKVRQKYAVTDVAPVKRVLHWQVEEQNKSHKTKIE
jgi:hypothetical protein